MAAPATVHVQLWGAKSPTRCPFTNRVTVRVVEFWTLRLGSASDPAELGDAFNDVDGAGGAVVTPPLLGRGTVTPGLDGVGVSTAQLRTVVPNPIAARIAGRSTRRRTFGV